MIYEDIPKCCSFYFVMKSETRMKRKTPTLVYLICYSHNTFNDNKWIHLGKALAVCILVLLWLLQFYNFFFCSREMIWLHMPTQMGPSKGVLRSAYKKRLTRLIQIQVFGTWRWVFKWVFFLSNIYLRWGHVLNHYIFCNISTCTYSMFCTSQKIYIYSSGHIYIYIYDCTFQLIFHCCE